jgi:hypothetical protein
MKRICRYVIVSFGLLYLAALAVFLIGAFGLFGSPTGPLAGIFLVPLGLPWNLMLDGISPHVLPWVAAAAPIANLILLWGLCRLITPGVVGRLVK